MRRGGLVPLVGAASALALLGTSPTATATAPRFGKPLLLTTGPVGGYEPGVVVDRFGNVVVTAHKSDYTLFAAPDPASPAGARAMSWVWWSKDGGRTFSTMPGATALDEQSAMPGAEGDLAWDATGHVYFVDTSAADLSFTRWRASGRGEIALETTRPVVGTAQADDRPWVVAHGDGAVLVVTSAVVRRDSGRIVGYVSHDHGDTFDPVGYTFNPSGSCRPIADRRSGSRTFYVVCDDFARTHWAFVTNDDGRTWTRSRMGGYTHSSSWINGAVAPDGTVYALYHGGGFDGDADLHLYASRNGGRTWTQRDITMAFGHLAYSWMDVAPDGTIGVAFYHRDVDSRDWHVFAGVAKPGQRFRYTSLAPRMSLAREGADIPWGDFFQVAFGPDSKLNVVWTADVRTTADPLDSHVYYAKQL